MQSINFDNLINRKDLLNSQQLPNNLLELISDRGKEWIMKILSIYGVNNSQIIKSKVPQQTVIEGPVYIGENVKIEPYSYIKGPAFIGCDSEIRHGAYIREYTYIGKNCVVGHTTEVKHSFFFDGAKASHFAYVGNSILGRHVNLGAGTKLANLKLDRSTISFLDPISKDKIDSGIKKFGAILGDYSQTGCNCVLSPGTIFIPQAKILPCKHYRGTLNS